ncbi:MAG: LysM peptidoglycan-binding domain-containing protein [Polyangiaceae bacterium]|jgi:membrane-bound lytic murein transglycosylase D
MLRPSARRIIRAAGVWAIFVATTARGGEAPRAATKDTPPKTRSSGNGSKPGRGVDSNARRAIAGGPTSDDVAMGAESAEIRALREAERELFPGASPAVGSAWPTEIRAVQQEGLPRVNATGLPANVPPPPPSSDDTALGWLDHLELPDLPVRWDERLVRYLQFFRDDPRGHATFVNLYRHSGRWRDLMRSALRQKSLPEDLVWVSMIESGFDATAHSWAGAAGLWQFMPETAKIYGLVLDRWVDQRLNASAATQAAADFLSDLHRRFGSWELALAAFNMGYAGLSSVVRRYNTNDFWALARTEGTLPWETTLYVPKVLAAAVVAHNLAAFGFGEIALDPAVESDSVSVGPGTALSTIAQIAGCSVKDVESLNPELRAGRTPPAANGDAAYVVKVPPGKGAGVAQGLARIHKDPPILERYVVRFGETLDQIAAARRTTTQKLVELNAISPGEAVRGGNVLLVPPLDNVGSAADAAPLGPSTSASSPSGQRPTVVVPAEGSSYPDRKRVFYRVIVGDTLRAIASAMHVSQDDLRRWNGLDPSARLQEGMTLQAYVRESTDLSNVIVASEADVHVLTVGTDEFFAALERDKGFKRVTVVAKPGDTIESIGRRFDASARTMERINRRGRAEQLRGGEAVVVYVPTRIADRQDGKTGGVAAWAAEPAPNGPLPAPPVPDLMP